MLNPTDALESAENALRLVVRLRLGDKWLDGVSGERVEKFEARRDEEAKRRDGVRTANDLLQFTDFTDLTRLILANWEDFKPVFDDLPRLKAYFGVFEDVRNTIAHSRPLVPYERELLSGMANHIRNQVALYRSRDDPASSYYPRIESVTDSIGNTAMQDVYHSRQMTKTGIRLSVGDTIVLSCRASDPLGRDLHWRLAVTEDFSTVTVVRWVEEAVAVGPEVSLKYTIEDQDYGESFSLAVFLHNESRYRRIKNTYALRDPEPGFDDRQYLNYSVNPPVSGELDRDSPGGP